MDYRPQMSLSPRVPIWNEGRPPDFKNSGKAPPLLFDFRVQRAKLSVSRFRRCAVEPLESLPHAPSVPPYPTERFSRRSGDEDWASQVAPHAIGGCMLGAERLLAYCQRAFQERPRPRKVALARKHGGEVVEARIVAVAGCSGPNFASSIASARSQSGCAATYSPRSMGKTARSLRLVAVSGCSGPSVSSRIQRALDERPRPRKLALVFEQQSEVVEARRRVGMLGAERLFCCHQCIAKKRGGVGISRAPRNAASPAQAVALDFVSKTRPSRRIGR
jgi:hypothetical protein